MSDFRFPYTYRSRAESGAPTGPQGAGLGLSCHRPALDPFIEGIMKNHSALSGPLAVLILPKSVKDLLTFGKAVHDAMVDNPRFPSPNPPLDVFKASLNALDDAETKAAARTKGAVMERNTMKKQVANDLYHLRDYVQGVAEKTPSPEAAAAVITSAFMSIRKVPQRVMSALTVKNTGIPGQVVLAAKTVAPVATYYWEHSPDQETWTSVPETLNASTRVDGLPWAKVTYFRFRALTRAGKGEYSQVVSLLVQ